MACIDGVRLLVGGGQRGERRAGVAARVAPPSGTSSTTSMRSSVSVPGLVGAHDVDAGQALDGAELLDEAALAAEADDADGEGDAGQQHEALGDHGDDAGDRAADGVGEALVVDAAG